MVERSITSARDGWTNVAVATQNANKTLIATFSMKSSTEKVKPKGHLRKGLKAISVGLQR
jgi:hypothetical protein